MKRTVTALYETREEAEKARDALIAAHISKPDEVEIRDKDDEEAGRHHRGLLGWLSDLFGGHHDHHHIYAEGLRRGHVLLIAKVDDLNETRAAIIMDTAAIDLAAVEKTWRKEGWKPAEPAPQSQSQSQSPGQNQAQTEKALETSPAEPDRGPYAPAPGSNVRAYTL
ncbi:MAG: hypothetical protein JWO83_1796 [Caulobacteraceae bacterium]|nr:hypothetical protein [Caulobacteraceae bacterium]